MNKLNQQGLEVYGKKSFSATNELEYVGFRITGIIPLPGKVEAIKNIAVSTTKKQLRSFIGLINYYRDMYVVTQIQHINSLIKYDF